MGRLLLISLLAALALAATSGAAAAEPRVTVISDSVLTSVLWHPDNLAILDQGVDLDMQVAVCRRLAGTSCVFDNVPPPTLLDLLPSLSNLGATVVVEMGYNDDPASFRANVEETIARLTARGVTHIIWPTLYVSKREFAAMNRVLVEAMIAHPQLALVDWDGYAQGHGDWFQTDHLHLMPAGGTGIATLLHQALAEPLSLAPDAALRTAQRGTRYRTRLGGSGTGGSWKIVSGRLPRGLRLATSGVVSGRPLQAGSARVALLFRSASFQLAHQLVEIRVSSPAAGRESTSLNQPRTTRTAVGGVVMKAPNSKTTQAGKRTNLTSRRSAAS